MSSRRQADDPVERGAYWKMSGMLDRQRRCLLIQSRYENNFSRGIWTSGIRSCS